ncbi:restriction endonuclease [Leptospira sp. 2 VSF19]|uniref:Restriction endonuclease n=1 Tax=Leptospira soteropolitanensis TaxID=2950025 RepID=A0AAW5VTV7_9LEPT|nr:restriction endonuclease [Leptospira soteropolitanensis]MCW7494848.1 restriction endonuclease [Leptospira soteropolitanensis]MCW7502435.1 restriction endonuclease [Leptospira soteropolitanensis]MCW7524668.1 restriction endonuclease [Leptospira soteropolitanensis]MCW7528538.1 restriction endonuclease [Leptospira soteropolitanensis]MCW7532405.1 restriction endonuclease [Leptospira soteropolitanensis]
MNNVFHYPPDLFDLVVQTIPLLNRSKDSVILFFKGAGVGEKLYKDISDKLKTDKTSISKYEICRTILERINEDSDKYLRERREILKRITEFEAYSTCWENDQLKAKGLVSEIQKIVNVKDSFTRMSQERERESNIRKKEYDSKMKELQKDKENRDQIKNEFFLLFSEQNAAKRGKQLEIVLNKYFALYQILLKEDFRRTGEPGDGIIEQIDGIIEIDNQIFLAEMKWKKDSIGSDDIYAHLGRIYHRANAHGIFISASGYSPSAIIAGKEALAKNALLVLFDLEEFVKIIEKEENFKQYTRDKIQAAIIEKNPYKKW